MTCHGDIPEVIMALNHGIIMALTITDISTITLMEAVTDEASATLGKGIIDIGKVMLKT